MSSFDGKLAVVSGGSGTVGSGTLRDQDHDARHLQPQLAGIIKAFLEVGANVVAPVRSEEGKESLVEELGGTQPDNLDIVIADVGSEEGAGALAAHIRDNHNGAINFAVSSCGAWWQGATLSNVSFDDFKTELDNFTTGHFLFYKHLINLLPDENESSFTFITGGAGAKCFVPDASMVTVGGAAVFGLAQAAFAEQQEASRRTLEVRLTALIRRERAEHNENFQGAPCYDHVVMGRHVVNVAEKAQEGIIEIGDDVLSAS